MDECYIIGDIFEQEDWFRVFFINPPNGEELHDKGLIEYTWGLPTPPSVDALDQYETVDMNREAHYMFSRPMELGDPDSTSYTIDVKARDTRFKSLDISDTEEATVEIDLPCVTAGNEPDFTISDELVYEPKTGSTDMVFTISASEAVIGLPITVDYCTEDVTASSSSSTIEVQHVAYDKNTPPEPFISYLEFGNVRAVFDASFPKFYNARFTDPTYSNAWLLLTNMVTWINTKGGNNILFLGDRDDSAASYSIKSTGNNGFFNSIRPHLESLGLTVDTLFHTEIGASPGEPTPAEIKAYDAIVYMSSAHGSTGDQILGNILVNSIESAVRQGVGILIITDHMDSSTPASGFAVGANQIANRFYAEFSSSIDRRVGTDFDEVRATYGDHPLISGITGTMPGDNSEGKVETNNQVITPDYVRTCGTLTFNEGDISKTVTVQINSDNLDENVETFNMNLTNLSRGNLTDDQGIGTIDLVPTIITELSVVDNSIREVYVAKDTSGSTDSNKNMTVNGTPNLSRRRLMDQIIIDYNLAVDDNPGWDYNTNNHGNDRWVDNPPTYNNMGGANTENHVIPELVEIINAINADTTLTDASVLIMNDSSDDSVIYSQNFWIDGSLPAIRNNVNIKLTVIRTADRATHGSGANYLNSERNFVKLLKDFNALDPSRFNSDDSFPANTGQFWNSSGVLPVGTDYFQTFNEYTTGADTLLNRMLNQATQNEYTSYCNVHGPGSAITVYATDQQQAQQKAESQITCP